MTKYLFAGFIIFYFMPSLKIAGIALSDIFLVSLFIVLLKNFHIKINNNIKKIIFYYFIFIISYTLSEIFHLYIDDSYHLVPDKIAYFYFGLLILVFSSINLSKKIIIKISIFSIILNSLILPYLFLIINLNTYNKLHSLFLKPNQLALFLLVAPVLLTIVLYIQRKKLNFLKNIVLYIFLLYIPMVATASKSGILLLVLLHLIVIFFTFSKWKSILISIVFIIFFYTPSFIQGFLINTVPQYFPQFSRVSTFLYEDKIKYEDNFRKINNREGLEIFSKNPIIGIGFGGDEMRTSSKHEIHNTYIRLLSTLGLIGTLSFLFFILYIILLSAYTFKNSIFIFLNIPILLFGLYHDIFTSKYFFIEISFLILLYKLKLYKLKRK